MASKGWSADRRTAMSDATGATTFVYDPAGLLVQVDALQGTAGYVYHAPGGARR